MNSLSKNFTFCPFFHFNHLLFLWDIFYFILYFYFVVVVATITTIEAILNYSFLLNYFLLLFITIINLFHLKYFKVALY
jgi:hypothetical protein